MALRDWFQKARTGRRRVEPVRETIPTPGLSLIGQPQSSRRFAYKPTPLNLRYFSKTVYARRAINAIKNPICQLEWEIVPAKGAKLNSELQRQIDATSFCLDNPNSDDSARTLFEQVLDDVMCGAGAIEVQVSSDPARPLWMWPVDGLSIQVYPLWSGDPNEPRYMQALGYGQVGGGREGIPLRNDELIYIRPSPSTTSPFGLGPLEVAFLSVARKLGVEKYAGDVSSNASPGKIIDLGPKADPQKVSAFRKFFKNEIEGRGITPIIGGMEDAKVINLFPDGDKALFLDYQELLIREIAAAFDLSPQNFGIEHDVNRNTSEASEDRDWDQAIKPRAHELASYITREALHRRLGFSQLVFRFKGLDREDEDAQSTILDRYYKDDVFTANDIRQQLGLEPSKNPFCDLTYTDKQIAIAAARGAKAIDDSQLPGNTLPASQKAPASPKPPATPPDLSETEASGDAAKKSVPLRAALLQSTVLQAGYNPGEPRDYHGRWTSGGASDAEKEAIKQYTGGDYLQINRELRGIRPNSGKYSSTVEALDKMLERSSAPEATTVYRGVGSLAVEQWAAKLKKGEIIDDPGFVSTSKSEGVAKRFAQQATKNMLLKINVPKGANVSNISDLSDAPTNEQEVLLPRNSAFKVVKWTPKTKTLEVDLI